MDDASDLLVIARALAGTWLASPLASDTAEGIAHWWFDWEGKVTKNDLAAALDWMVEQELIMKIDAADGRCRYCRIASDAKLIALLAGSAPH